MPQNSEPIAVSALAQYVYCPRRCALIHLEHQFEENVFTIRGRLVHEQVDEPITALEGDRRIEQAVPLWSDRLGLVGKADVVEFLPDGTPYPVEYKSGRRRPRRAIDVQLCAQALCLEEMLNRPVPRGAVFHHASRRRREVEFTETLRADVENVGKAVRELLAASTIPPPLADARCPNCSLIDVCMPAAVGHVKTRRDELFSRVEPGRD